MLELAAAADKAAEKHAQGQRIQSPALDGLPAQDLRSDSVQEVLHEVQWKLLSYAERCYWGTSVRKNSLQPKQVGCR